MTVLVNRLVKEALGNDKQINTQRVLKKFVMRDSANPQQPFTHELDLWKL